MSTHLSELWMWWYGHAHVYLNFCCGIQWYSIYNIIKGIYFIIFVHSKYLYTYLQHTHTHKHPCSHASFESNLEHDFADRICIYRCRCIPRVNPRASPALLNLKASLTTPDRPKFPTVDGSIQRENQLRLVVYPLYLSRFHTCQVVVWDFFHQQYDLPTCL